MKRTLRGLAIAWYLAAAVLIVSEAINIPHIRDVAIIVWVVLTLVAVTTAIPLIRKRDRDRLAQSGRCIRCGYNLAGNASGVCPECGTPVQKNSGSSN